MAIFSKNSLIFIAKFDIYNSILRLNNCMANSIRDIVKCFYSSIENLCRFFKS